MKLSKSQSWSIILKSLLLLTFLAVLLLLLLRGFSNYCYHHCYHFWSSVVGMIGQNAAKAITLPSEAMNMPFNPLIQAGNVFLLLKNFCYCPFLLLLLLLLTIAKGLPELLLLQLISDLLGLCYCYWLINCLLISSGTRDRELKFGMSNHLQKLCLATKCQPLWLIYDKGINVELDVHMSNLTFLWLYLYFLFYLPERCSSWKGRVDDSSKTLSRDSSWPRTLLPQSLHLNTRLTRAQFLPWLKRRLGERVLFLKSVQLCGARCPPSSGHLTVTLTLGSKRSTEGHSLYSSLLGWNRCQASEANPFRNSFLQHWINWWSMLVSFIVLLGCYLIVNVHALEKCYTIRMMVLSKRHWAKDRVCCRIQ